MPAYLPSELPVRRRTRHHWVVLFRLPGKFFGALLLVLFGCALIWPQPAAWLLGGYVAVGAFLRWQTWQAEWIILTGKRIIRVQGVPETTTSEASLRLDRVSGARLVQTVPGKVLGYGNVELEAPGEHPGVRRLIKINDAVAFYLTIRPLIFGDRSRGPDPDDDPRDYSTEPLPPYIPPKDDRRGG